MKAKDHEARLQDDFYDYVNGAWAETAVIPGDNRQPVVYGLDQDIENLMLDITGKWHSAKLCQIPKMIGRYDAREAAGVAPAMPLIESRPYLSALKTIPASWAPMS